MKAAFICRGHPFRDADDAYDYFRQREIDEQTDQEKAMTRLTPAQTQAAKDRVGPCAGGFRYWTWNNNAPVFQTRREAEDASIAEWRANLEPQVAE